MGFNINVFFKNKAIKVYREVNDEGKLRLYFEDSISGKPYKFIVTGDPKTSFVCLVNNEDYSCIIDRHSDIYIPGFDEHFTKWQEFANYLHEMVSEHFALNN